MPGLTPGKVYSVGWHIYLHIELSQILFNVTGRSFDVIFQLVKFVSGLVFG